MRSLIWGYALLFSRKMRGENKDEREVWGMEEREIIRGESKDYGKIPLALAIVAVIGIAVCFFYAIPMLAYERGNKLYWLFQYMTDAGYAIVFWLSIALLPTSIILFMLSKCEIVVTDKRVFGKARFHKNVDIPIDSISAVGTSAFNGIAVASSSGRIVFYEIKNRDEISKAISNLLISRQTGNKGSQPSNADELGKFKELLDKGIITQEEFDAKKKQLLGL